MNSFITKENYARLRDTSPYYNNRWHYFSKAISMIECETFETCLELGVGPIKSASIVKGATTMGLKDANINHDATVIPWPIADKSYDLFVSLQVFEHLKDKQKEAFKEAKRISKMALISFPLWWKGDEKHSVTRADIKEWTDGLVPIRSEFTGMGAVRLVNLYKFE